MMQANFIYILWPGVFQLFHIWDWLHYQIYLGPSAHGFHWTINILSFKQNIGLRFGKTHSSFVDSCSRCPNMGQSFGQRPIKVAALGFFFFGRNQWQHQVVIINLNVLYMTRYFLIKYNQSLTCVMHRKTLDKCIIYHV